jgi:hypothetical protein
MANENDKIMKDAQFRKGLSIAFFNATNAAIEFAKINGMAGVMDSKKFITEWRDFFIEEHKNYYATVIANVGVNYKPEDSIKKLQATKTLEELQSAWVLLSADERKDSEIIKVAQQLKGTYKNEKIQPSGTTVSGVAPVKKGKNNGNDTKVNNGNA